VEDGVGRVQAVILRVIKHVKVEILETVRSTWAKATDYKTFLKLSDAPDWQKDSAGADSAVKEHRKRVGASVLGRLVHIMFQLQEQYPEAMKYCMIGIILYSISLAFILVLFFGGDTSW
jgi:hypothetical protein